MKVRIPINGEFSLLLSDEPGALTSFPTGMLQRGFLLAYQHTLLAEEAVGFGVPVLKAGLKTYFPGNASIKASRDGPDWQIDTVYTINLQERLVKPDGRPINSPLFYSFKNRIEALIRNWPRSGKGLTALSSSLRRLFGWRTAFFISPYNTAIRMLYTCTEGANILTVTADLSGLSRDGITEVVIMNEQGARAFDQYHDTAGLHLGMDKIGYWDIVKAEEASFSSTEYRVRFTMPQIQPAVLYRGRELVDSRLAWSGFGYSITPGVASLSYTVRIDQGP